MRHPELSHFFEAEDICGFLQEHFAGRVTQIDGFDVERKFCETRMYQVAPVDSNMIKAFIGTKVLGLPRSH